MIIGQLIKLLRYFSFLLLVFVSTVNAQNIETVGSYSPSDWVYKLEQIQRDFSQLSTVASQEKSINIGPYRVLTAEPLDSSGFSKIHVVETNPITTEIKFTHSIRLNSNEFSSYLEVMKNMSLLSLELVKELKQVAQIGKSEVSLIESEKLSDNEKQKLLGQIISKTESLLLHKKLDSAVQMSENMLNLPASVLELLRNYAEPQLVIPGIELSGLLARRELQIAKDISQSKLEASWYHAGFLGIFSAVVYSFFPAELQHGMGNALLAGTAIGATYLVASAKAEAKKALTQYQRFERARVEWQQSFNSKVKTLNSKLSSKIRLLGNQCKNMGR